MPLNCYIYENTSNTENGALAPEEQIYNSVQYYGYCAFQKPVQPNFRRYYFYFLPDQAQTHLDHFNVLDELWGEISTRIDNR